MVLSVEAIMSGRNMSNSLLNGFKTFIVSSTAAECEDHTKELFIISKNPTELR